jgi:hypothetical protein
MMLVDFAKLSPTPQDESVKRMISGRANWVLVRSRSTINLPGNESALLDTWVNLDLVTSIRNNTNPQSTSFQLESDGVDLGTVTTSESITRIKAHIGLH